MLFRCPNSGIINTMYIEFISPIHRVEPSEENKFTKPMYVFAVHMMSGFVIGFEEEMEQITEGIRRDLVAAINEQR